MLTNTFSNRNWRRVFLLIASVLLALFVGHTQASANTVSVNGLGAADATITNDQGVTQSTTGNLDKYSAYQVHYKWSINDTTKLAKGDTATVSLPANVASSYDYSFDLTDAKSQAKIGTFTIQKGSQSGTITFNDYLVTHTTARQGTLQLAANGKHVNTDNTNWLINKVGWLTNTTIKDGHPTTANWNIAFNPDNKDLTNVTLTDTLGSDQTYVPGSIKVDGNVPAPDVTVNGNTITMKFGHVSKKVNLNYQTSITGVPSDSHWSNAATLTATNGSVALNKTVHGTIAWGGNGEGNGDEQAAKGNVTLIKTDQWGCKRLANAHFNLYTAAGKLDKSDVTTDYRGELTVGNLKYGSYYFVETKAPRGYRLSSRHLTFTLNDKMPAAKLQVPNAKKSWGYCPSFHKVQIQFVWYHCVTWQWCLW